MYQTLCEAHKTTVNRTDKAPTLLETHSGGADGKLTHKIIIVYEKIWEGNK